VVGGHRTHLLTRMKPARSATYKYRESKKMKQTQLIRFGDYTDIQKSRVTEFILNLCIDQKNEYKITVEKYKENKTSEQLGYYWTTIIRVCMDWQGLAKDDADVWLKEKCAIPRIITIMGETFEIRASIAKMKIDEMSRYIDDCVNFMGTHGQYTPPPTRR